MKFYVREPDRSGFQGPMSSEEIQSALAAGRLSPQCEVVEATGQSSFQLSRSTRWKRASDVGITAAYAPPAQPAVKDVRFVAVKLARGWLILLAILAAFGAGITLVASDSLHAGSDALAIAGYVLGSAAAVSGPLILAAAFREIQDHLVDLHRQTAGSGGNTNPR